MILKRVRTAAAVALALGLCACGTNQANPGSETAIKGELCAISEPEAIAYDDYEAAKNIVNAYPLADDTEGAINRFALETASPLLQERGNQCYSPVSLYYALALCTSGAQGETQQQMLSLLGMADNASILRECENLYRQLYFNNAYGRIRLASSMWVDKTLPLKQDYIDTVKGKYFTSLYQADLKNEEAGKEIAKWVSEQTGGLLSTEEKIDSGTLAVLLNTVYFQDEWTDAFLESETAGGKFYQADGNASEALFMHRTNQGTFARGDGFARAALHTKNNAEIVFVLPEKGRDLRALISTPEGLDNLLNGGENSYGLIQWSVPKFSTNSRLELNDTLKALGMTDAFTDSADFGGMSDQQLLINTVIQGTHISINEKGIEAAAYTEIMMNGTALPTDSLDMTLDHPFLYAIKVHGVPLFIGICEDPSTVK